VETLAAKIDQLSTHRSESFDPHHFELLCRWHSGEWGSSNDPAGAISLCVGMKIRVFVSIYHSILKKELSLGFDSQLLQRIICRKVP